MQKFVVGLIVLVVLVLAVFILQPGGAHIDRRGWLIITKASLRDADAELHEFGVFTNHPPTSKYIRVFPYTNRFSIDGIDYQCELAAECERLTNRGFLTITTNQIFIWVDTKGRQTPLAGAQMLPAGF